MLSRVRTKEEAALPQLNFNDGWTGEGKLSEYQSSKLDALRATTQLLPRAKDIAEWSERWYARAAAHGDLALRTAMSVHGLHMEQVARAHGFEYALRYEVEVAKLVRAATVLDIASIDASATIITDRNTKAKTNMKTAAAAVKAATQH